MLGRDEPLLVAPAELGDERLARPAERDDRCVGDAGGADRLADGHLDLIDRGVERGASHHGAVAPVPLAERRERGQRRIGSRQVSAAAGTSSALAAQVAVTANSPRARDDRVVVAIPERGAIVSARQPARSAGAAKQA